MSQPKNLITAGLLLGIVSLAMINLVIPSVYACHDITPTPSCHVPSPRPTPSCHVPSPRPTPSCSIPSPNPTPSCSIPSPNPTPSCSIPSPKPTPSMCPTPTPPIPSVCPPTVKPPMSPNPNPSNSGKKYLFPFLDKKKILNGMMQTGRIAIYGINFDFDRSDIRPDSEPTLDEIAAVLKQNPKLKIYIVGHADIIGDFNYNVKLSKSRAQAVVNALVSRYGIAPNRLTAYGLGQTAPISSNDTDEGRLRNRRVELVKVNS